MGLQQHKEEMDVLQSELARSKAKLRFSDKFIRKTGKKKETHGTPKEKAEALFQQYDDNQDGYLCKSEIENIYLDKAMKVESDFYKKLLKFVSKGFSFTRFVKWYSSGERNEQFLQDYEAFFRINSPQGKLLSLMGKYDTD